MRRLWAWILAGVLACAVLAPLAIRAELDGGYVLETIRAWRRDVADYRFATSLQSVASPESALVLAALEQSNSGNHVGSRVPAAPALPAFAFFRDPCVPLSDPIPGATGTDGSLWTALAHRLIRERVEAVVVVAGAAAGSSVRHWGRHYAGIRRWAQRSSDGAAAVGLVPNPVMWLQGNADGMAGTSRTSYEEAASSFCHYDTAVDHHMFKSRNLMLPVFLVTQSSRCGVSQKGSEEVRSAYQAGTGRYRRVSLGPNTDSLDDEHRLDCCHFNDSGRSRIVSTLLTLLTSIPR